MNTLIGVALVSMTYAYYTSRPPEMLNAKAFPAARRLRRPPIAFRRERLYPQGNSGDQLSFAFSACIDYVIVHELCHLKEHHHGPAFVARLDRIMPDWRDRRERLNTEL